MTEELSHFIQSTVKSKRGAVDVAGRSPTRDPRGCEPVSGWLFFKRHIFRFYPIAFEITLTFLNRIADFHKLIDFFFFLKTIRVKSFFFLEKRLELER